MTVELKVQVMAQQWHSNGTVPTVPQCHHSHRRSTTTAVTTPALNRQSTLSFIVILVAIYHFRSLW